MRPPTHKPLDMQRLMRIATELEEAFEMSEHASLSPEAVDELADEIGAPASHVYAAAAMMTELPMDESAPIRFELCAGGCQSWGALPLIDKLSVAHAQRRENGEAGFGIVARRCIDKCAEAPVVLIRTPDGTAGLLKATPEALDEALSQALEV